MSPKWLIGILLLAFVGCKEKKKDLEGSAPVKFKDIFEAYNTVTPPITIYDTSVQRLTDTTHIGYKALAQFIPDSVLKKYVAADSKKTAIKPLGKIVKDNETYLLTSFTQNKKIKLGAFVFDKKEKYLANLLLLNTAIADDYSHAVNINREPTFILSSERVAKEKLMYTRNGMAYTDGAKDFISVINESNENTKLANEILNPIDTFARANKFSGDYVQDKKNFISIRDGKNADNYLFFIHFEKNDGQCVGELKGNMMIHHGNKAIYKQNGDACVIDFSFNGNEIEIKEQGSCGNHRGVRCAFNDTYIKKKEAKKPSPKKK
ncbi:MAG: hypothetical protein J0I41_01725 [Filimonas sp.]|nr:hypothetical protein [Filimonas sp.]